MYLAAIYVKAWVRIVTKALGFSDGNALMATLKASEDPKPAAVTPHALDVRPATPGDTAGHLYTLTFPFVSDEDGMEAYDLPDIVEAVTSGAAIGGTGRHVTITRTPVDRATRDRLARAFDSDPSFFFDEGYGRDDDDPRASAPQTPAGSAKAPLPPLLEAFLAGEPMRGDGLADAIRSAQFFLETCEHPHKRSILQKIERAVDAFNQEGDEEFSAHMLERALKIYRKPRA